MIIIIIIIIIIIVIIIIIMEFKTRVIPVIIGATEPISKSFRKYVSTIPGNHEVKEQQKTAILGTAHTLRKVLMQQYIRANAGAGDVGTIHSSDRMAVTLYSLGT
jgi:hypothetical protein